VAAERLVTANLRFVISYVKKYQGHGLELGELVAIGNEGLLKAVRKFDPDQGVKFISYAVWWVRQAVLKALAEQTRSVRIPLNQNSALIRISKGEALLAQVLRRDPSDEELARLLDEEIDAVHAARKLSTIEVSLDAPVERGERDAGSLGERFADESARRHRGRHRPAPHARAPRPRAPEHLTARERKILALYYGLEEGSEEMTLERIGALMGRHPRAHPADSRARLQQAARVGRRLGARRVLERGVT
jgi:RNA polymerase primary sigma factor